MICGDSFCNLPIRMVSGGDHREVESNNIGPELKMNSNNMVNLYSKFVSSLTSLARAIFYLLHFYSKLFFGSSTPKLKCPKSYHLAEVDISDLSKLLY